MGCPGDLWSSRLSINFLFNSLSEQLLGNFCSCPISSISAPPCGLLISLRGDHASSAPSAAPVAPSDPSAAPSSPSWFLDRFSVSMILSNILRALEAISACFWRAARALAAGSDSGGGALNGGALRARRGGVTEHFGPRAVGPPLGVGRGGGGGLQVIMHPSSAAFTSLKLFSARAAAAARGVRTLERPRVSATSIPAGVSQPQFEAKRDGLRKKENGTQA